MTYLSPEYRQELLDAGFPVEELKLGVAEEILRRLPYRLDGKTLFVKSLADLGWMVSYGNVRPFAEWKGDMTLANAAAAMYCYLTKNGLLPTEA